MSKIFKSPERASATADQYITFDQNGKVVLHEKILETPPQYLTQPEATTESRAEFELTIRGRAPLNQLVRIASAQPGSNMQYMPNMGQEPIQMDQSVPMTPPAYEAPIWSTLTRTERDTIAPRTRNESWSLQADGDYIETPRPKRKASKRIIAISALIACGLAVGPTTQLAYAGPEAAKICAKDGMWSILGNPGCFANQAFDVFLNPKNILNVIPPEHKSE
jgi:hypothetical protein